MNIRYVTNQFCVLVMLLGSVMLLVAAVYFGIEALLHEDISPEARLALFVTGGVSIAIGGAGWWASRPEHRKPSGDGRPEQERRRSPTPPDLAPGVKKPEGKGRHLGRREALLLVALSWVGGAALAAMPSFLWAHFAEQRGHPFANFVDCYFEAMSGLTTTGATVLSDIETLPRSLLLWRGLTHWLGGLGIVVLFVAVLPSLGVGAKKLYRVEAPGPKAEGLQPQIRETARVLWYIYLGLTVAQTVALWIAGMGLFDALCHTFATLATGGFSTHNASIGQYDQESIRLVVIAFMVLAGLNFGLYYQLIRRRFATVFRDVEMRLYLALLIVGSAVVFGAVYHQSRTAARHGELPVAVAAFDRVEVASTRVAAARDAAAAADERTAAEAELADAEAALAEAAYPLRSTRAAEPIPPTAARVLSESIFTTVSIQTTTGFATSDSNRWPFLAHAVLVMLMFVGGSSGSTSGGIKVIRIWIAVKVMLSEIERVFRPHVIRPMLVGGGKIDPELKLATLAYVLGIVILFIGGSGAIMLLEQAHESGCSFTTASTASIATLCTIGPGLDQVGAIENYGWFSAPSKLVMCVLMALGRLEVFAIIVLFSPKFWRGD